MNEEVWFASDSTVTDFITIRPVPGLKSDRKTSARLVYDDFALYFFVTCYDVKDSISEVYTVRDDFNANADIFSIFLDTYNDHQNGFYFEFDGQKLYACRRFSNKELFGKVATTKYSSEIVGTGTSFRKQLTVGDMVVIRGQSYRVNQINNDFNMIVSPAYRGPSAATARILKTQIEKIPQSDWNVDKMNGTGPSGYTLDVAKMQMTYIDYSWYGAGSIRFGMRTVDGGIAWCHDA